MKIIILVLLVFALAGGAAHIATSGASAQQILLYAKQKTSELLGGPPPMQDVRWIKRQFRDVAYGLSPAQKMDIYLPNEGEGPFPALFLSMVAHL
jgi:hypothetical protein